MEGIGEEVIGNDNRGGNVELQGKGCDVPVKLEDPNNVLDSPMICASFRGDWPGTSSNDYADSSRIVDNDLNRRLVSLGGSDLPQTGLCLLNDAENVVELTVGNYKTPNLPLVSSPASFWRGKWQPRAAEMPTGGLKQKVLHGLHDVNEIPSSLRTSDKQNLLSCAQPNADILAISSTSPLLANRVLKGKGAINKNGDAVSAFGGVALGHGDGRLIHARRVASDALMRSSAKRNQFSSHKIGGSGNESLHRGINLSDCLKPGCRRGNKDENLIIFRQIVELVDSAHSQGVALKDLRPSCFNMLPSNRILYTGSTTKREADGTVSHDSLNKRPMEQDTSSYSTLVAKQQKLNNGVKHVGQLSHSASNSSSRTLGADGIEVLRNGEVDFGHVELQSQNPPKRQSSFSKTRQQYLSFSTQLEEKWYKSPEQLNEGSSSISSNIYSLGVLLFELLSWFGSEETRSAVMLDLCQRILPPNFLSENPKEAGFCLWFLHPEPSSRPTARQILQSELISRSQESCSGNNALTRPDNNNGESELLLHFLNLLKEQKQTHASKLVEDIECLDRDIEEVAKRHQLRISSLVSGTKERLPNAIVHRFDTGLIAVDISRTDPDRKEVRPVKIINRIGDAYFTMRSRISSTTSASRLDKDFLKNRERWSTAHNENGESNMIQKSEDPLGAFFEGFCKFARYSKFEVCGLLKNRDLLSSTNVLCSLSFDRDEEFIAAAGVSRKIKIFEFEALLNDSMDIHYPVVEMSNKSKLSCVSWNKYIKNYLASTDYDGIIQMWDASTGQGLFQYKEHQKRAWSVDFSLADPMLFASGSDDCSVKLWSINEGGSLGTIWNPANICCVQFSASSNHLLAFGSADYKIYCYDLRHTKIPWCTLAGHEKAVSYVKFLDSETIVSASTDNTLKLWDLNKTSSTGLSSGACSLTFSGHANEKNFVGLSTMDGYIACGSETNEVYCYYRSLPMPITSYKFGYVDPFSGNKIVDDSGQFVSSVCWRQKSDMVIAANSMGNMKVLKMV